MFKGLSSASKAGIAISTVLIALAIFGVLKFYLRKRRRLISSRHEILEDVFGRDDGTSRISQPQVENVGGFATVLERSEMSQAPHVGTITTYDSRT